MSDISLAVWDVPMPVTAGESFAVKVGAKAIDARALGGGVVEVSDAGGVVASGVLGDAILPGTEALYWCGVNVPAPTGAATYTVRLAGAVATQFSVVAAARPEHTLRVSIVEAASAQPLPGVEIRLGPFQARTGTDGRAALRLCKGDYRLQLWLGSHLPPAQQSVTVDGDAELALTMTFVTEDHPDARWVR